MRTHKHILQKRKHTMSCDRLCILILYQFGRKVYFIEKHHKMYAMIIEYMTITRHVWKIWLQMNLWQFNCISDREFVSVRPYYAFFFELIILKKKTENILGQMMRIIIPIIIIMLSILVSYDKNALDIAIKFDLVKSSCLYLNYTH